MAAVTWLNPAISTTCPVAATMTSAKPAKVAMAIDAAYQLATREGVLRRIFARYQAMMAVPAAVHGQIARKVCSNVSNRGNETITTADTCNSTSVQPALSSSNSFLKSWLNNATVMEKYRQTVHCRIPMTMDGSITMPNMSQSVPAERTPCAY